MKQILLMRHAKSDWNNSSERDFDRPLNSRGKKAAPFMGKEILKLKLTPDLIIASTAKRAKMTAEAVAEKSNYKGEIVWNQDFYYGFTEEPVLTIKKLSNNINRVMIVGHNPTWEDLLTKLTGKFDIMQTAVIAVLNFNLENWADLTWKTCELNMVLRPKELM